MSTRGLHTPENIAYLILAVAGLGVFICSLLIGDDLLLLGIVALFSVALGGYTLGRLSAKK